MKLPTPIVLLCVANPDVGEIIREGIRAHQPALPIRTIPDWQGLRLALGGEGVLAIVMDSPFPPTDAAALEIERLTRAAPVILLGPVAMRDKVTNQIATGRADFVQRAGNFARVVAALIDRRLHEREFFHLNSSISRELPGEWLEDLRHEINNPLTGILGNAEMLLGSRERLPAPVAQRLEAIVSLALKLRSSVLHLTQDWQRARQAAASE
jgi:signal transduction histidine kinase